MTAGPPAPCPVSALCTTKRVRVDIELVGATNVGKSALLEAMIDEHDPGALPHFEENRSNLMTHHRVKIEGRPLKVLDCSANVRAQFLVKEWYARASWVVVVYDVGVPSSLDAALEMLPEIQEAGAQIVLFGSKLRGAEVRVDMSAVREAAARIPALAIESASLVEVARLILAETDSGVYDAPERANAGTAQAP